MRKPISKAQIRQELAAQVDAYIDAGGKVKRINRGVSGRDALDGPIKPQEFSQRPKTPRTYVPEVIAAIDARRQKKIEQKRRRTPPRKRIIYDDFGEPLRWEWIDD